MRTSILAALAATALLSTLAASAQALTLPRAVVGQDEATLAQPARDGCGWHRHYSRHLGHCVWN